jgi:DNA-binding transcriptional regulator YhcF (GntR family)
VVNLGASGNHESLRTAKALIDDCVEACRELGLTTDEIRQLMTKRLRKVPEDGKGN